MSQRGNSARPGKRNRAGEAAEQRRAELRSAKRCVRCKRPSPTVRCRRCDREVEANTARYRGMGRQGPPLKAQSDAVDLRLAMSSLQPAAAGFAEVARDASLSPKERAAALSEHMAAIWLVERLLRGVRRRNRELEAAALEPRAPLQRPATRHPQLVFPFFRRMR